MVDTVAPWDAVLAQDKPLAPWDAVLVQDRLNEPTVNAPHGIINAMVSGWQSSATGLIKRGKLPEQQLPEDSTYLERATSTATSLIAELPIAIPAAYLGGQAGAAGGTALAGPEGTVPGAVLGSGAAAVGVPMALRDGLMQAYATGGVHSWGDLWDIIKASSSGGAKGAVVGAATLGAGRVVGGAVAKTAAPALAQTAAVAGSEIATMATTAAALEGRLPTAQEFGDAAILVGGLRTVTKVASNLRTIYRKTGIPPEQVVLDAQQDPVLREEIANIPAGEVPTKYQALAAEENAKAAIPGPEVNDRAAAAKFVQQPFGEWTQPPGHPTKPTAINHNYLNAEADIHGAEARLADLYLEQTQKARRGTVPQAQSIAEANTALADALGTTPGKLNELLTGEIPQEKLASTLLARRQLYVDTVADLNKQGKALAEAGANVTDNMMLNYMALVERSSMVRAQFLGLRAEVARAQQSLKSIVTPEAHDALTIKKILLDYGGSEEIQAFAKKMSEADNPATAGRMADIFVKPTLLDKTIEGFKAFIFSGPTTHLANIMGNTMALPFPVLERALASKIGFALKSSERVAPQEAAAMVTGWKMASIDMYKATAETTKNIPGIISSIVQATKGKSAAEIKAMAEKVLNGDTDQYGKVDVRRQAITGLTGAAIRLPFRALSAEDTPFRMLNERAEAYALATRQAFKEGFSYNSDGFNARVMDVVNNPEVNLVTENYAQSIKAAGDRGVFTSKLGNRATHVDLAIRGSIFEFIIPVRKTAMNLFKWGAERTPIANFAMENVRKDLLGENGPIARDMAMARTIVGGVTIGLIIAATKNGTVVGGGLADPDKARARRTANIPDYSLKIGNTHHGFDRMAPVGPLLMFAADIAEMTEASDSPQKGEILSVAAAVMGNATISQTYLSGLSDSINAITAPGRYGARFMDQHAASIVPNFIGQIASSMDPNQREVNSMLEAMQARVPIWREHLLPKINPLTGELMPAKEKLFPMAPIVSETESTDKVLTEAVRLGIAVPPTPRSVHVGPGTGKIGKVEISPEARNAFTQEQGRVAHDILSQLVNDPTWDAQPDLLKERIYAKVISRARLEASLVALPPEARQAEAERIYAEIQEKMNE